MATNSSFIMVALIKETTEDILELLLCIICLYSLIKFISIPEEKKKKKTYMPLLDLKRRKSFVQSEMPHNKLIIPHENYASGGTSRINNGRKGNSLFGDFNNPNCDKQIGKINLTRFSLWII